jgi:large subunit ribosomal protein L22
MAYSFNMKREGLVFASAKDINASFKDLGAVCDAIRYKSAPRALTALEAVATGHVAILYRRHNAYMGSRHELGGQKGRYPKKCAVLVRKVLVNAMANAENKGSDPESMYVVHAAANKTMILPRTAPKGALWLGHSMGRRSARRTDLELARIEIGLGYGEEEGLSTHMKKALAAVKRADGPVVQKAKEVKRTFPKKQTQAGKPIPVDKPKEAQKA